MSEEGIAIIGIAGRFPGAQNVREFWENLVAGRETISRLADDPCRPDYVPARGLIERPEWFDAGFFGLTPKEAEVIDPQQRVFLEEAWTALEDAGIDPTRPPGPIGVFAGMSNNTYWAQNVSTRPDLIESVGWLNAMMGNEKDYLATRVAYKFDLRGPAISLYTACSTSLVAVCQACTSLLNFQCDAALAGGVSITFPQERGYEFHEGGITSPDGHCRAFDVNSAGTVFSHGVGVVVLKRLADAISAGDQIYAVIKGHALNNDGASKVSFTAPSVDGHTEVIALAQGFAGFSPDSIGYVEAHGTATPLGDPIEIAGLTAAFRAETERSGFCAIGSVKTNIGHLDAAAGIAGLIKTTLALQHGKIPASLHFTAPNPQLELEGSPFFVNTALRDWPTSPRRAGVSSFGVGGTNAHVVLEEIPPTAAATASGPELLVLSARSLRTLEDATTNLGKFLRAHPELSLADVAFTLQQGRRAFAFRRFVVAESTAEAGRLLLRRDRRRVFTSGTHATHGTDDSLCALGHRWLAGEDIDFPRTAGRKVSLPTYPFERQRHWAEPRATSIAAVPAPEPEPIAPADTFAALKAELTALSGVDVSAAPAETTLVDLGFDSLFLTQIAIVLQKKFGVRLRFRQFLDELATLGALAEYLRANQVASAPQPSPIIVPAASAPSKPAAHGPFRRIDTSATAELTPAQQQHLDELIARYTRRTAGSKRFTEEHRDHFADPRAVSGFRRAWKEMVYPLVADRSHGAKLWDIDGNEYTDITLGFGQILLGHRPDFLVEAIERQLHSGIEIGPTSPLAGDVAALMCELTGMERVGFCNTGSEAVMAAIRVARTVSGRDKIAVFAGAYHGIFDEVLFRPAGGGGAAAIAPGIPAAAISNVLVLDYGEQSAIDFIRAHAHELAAVLVEPVQSRRPELQPREFLHELRRVTAESEIALVFDEVVTGFRCHPGGAQAWFGVRADLATYGKVLGGGMPIGIVAGARHYMDALDGGAWTFGDDSVPEIGVTFFAGTFVRHPLALAAAKAVLTELKARGPALQERLNATAETFVGELNGVLEQAGAPLRWSRFSSMFHLPPPPEHKFAGVLWAHLRLRGIHAWEGRPNFISTAHTADDLARVLDAFRESVEETVGAGFLPRGRAPLIPQADGALPLTDAQQELWLASRLGS
ncbi:MAG: aminotransferase class III-fold pyridoxal phosphate-dependent enzyme, partial [Chthoniobacteraceae bacterium]